MTPTLNLGYVWSGGSTGCDTPYNTFFLDAQAYNQGVTVTFTASVGGQAITAYGGNTYTAGTSAMPVLFDVWPHLANGTYTVTITATAPGYATGYMSPSVTYQC